MDTSTIQVVTPARNPDAWNPAQYQRFANERSQPFFDLLSMLEPTSLVRAVDLGSGTGELTVAAARQLGSSMMTGIDNSPAMLKAAKPHASAAVRFEQGDIAEWTSRGDHDLVLSNAALQWVPNHVEVIKRWAAALAPGGQIAIQVPANSDHPSHRVAMAVATKPPYIKAFGGWPPDDPVAKNVLGPEKYAELLHELGFERQHVRLQVYGHLLDSSRDVVEWVKGTTLTRFKSLLSAEMYDDFLFDYRSRLLDAIGDRKPYFYPFKRILIWGRKRG